MKRSSIFFLKGVLCLIAIVVFVGMIRFPQTEGRAANLDLFSIYTDPFIWAIYIASTPFFAGLYQAFRLLSHIEANNAFSQGAVLALRNIKRASLTLICFMGFILLSIRFMAYGEDSAGVTALGILASLVIAVIATAAAVFQKLLQHAVDIKSEHDLTV